MKIIKNRIVICLLFCIGIIGFSACKKNHIWVCYDITWSDLSTVNGIGSVQAAKKHLRNKNIHVFKAEFTPDGTVDDCKCSNCRTGKRIKCEIRKDDLDNAIESNFYQE